MKIEVDAKYLTSLFADFVKGNKVMFNFKTDGKVLDVQMLGDYTACTLIPVKSLDGDVKECDASFWVTKAIAIMDMDKPIQITFADAVIFFEQSTFNSTFVKEHEERRVFQNTDGISLSPAYANRLKYLTHSVISCTGLAKELSIADPDPVFSNKKFYADYRQTFFIENMEYPEFCVPLSTLRDFAFKLEEKAEYAYLPDLNVVYFKSGRYEFWIPTNNYNISGAVISAIDKKLAKCVKVTELSFIDYVDKLSILATAFPKQKMSLLVGNGTFSIAINNSDVQCTVGDSINNSLLGINLTSGQVAVISKLFKEDEKVECLRGGNCICLRSGEKNLLIAGMIY